MKKIIFLLLWWIAPVMAATVSADRVVLQGMDKVTGRVRELSFPVGSSMDFDELTIMVDKCMTKTPEETPENAAFLRISQHGKEIFSGWMFSSNPAISAMEDPVYDVWVVECANESPALIESITDEIEQITESEVED